jgi:phosphohistidine phosphatase
MGSTIEVRLVDALYNASLEIYLEIIGAQESVNSVMLIGHNPTMEQTLEALIGHDALSQSLPTGFPTAGLAVLDYESGAARWRLVDFVID